MSAKRVVVVGGGVYGISSSWFLSQMGCDVTVLEAGDFAHGCSHGNCGFICPSHVLPLAEPGALKSGFWALIKPNGPLRIEPRFDPALWSWFPAFAKRCNKRDMISAGHALQPLLRQSSDLYQRLHSDRVIEAGMQQRGLLAVYRDAQAWEQFTSTEELLESTFHESASRLTAQEALRLEPSLAEGVAGAWHHTSDAHLDPARLMKSWRAASEKAGVRYVTESCVSSAREQGSSLLAVSVGDEVFEADHFVFATGALTPTLSQILKFRLPVAPGKGYSFTVPSTDQGPQTPLIFPETRVAVTPLGERTRIGSTMEFAGYNETIRPERLRLLRDGAQPFLRERLPEATNDPWFGWRPMTPDGVPLLGRSPVHCNVWVATGGNMIGVSTAPAAGRLVAELVTGSKPSLDPAPYQIERYVR